jgi:hypothetical protein
MGGNSAITTDQIKTAITKYLNECGIPDGSSFYAVNSAEPLSSRRCYFPVPVGIFTTDPRLANLFFQGANETVRPSCGWTAMSMNTYFDNLDEIPRILKTFLPLNPTMRLLKVAEKILDKLDKIQQTGV